MSKIIQNQLDECLLFYKKADYHSAIKNLKDLDTQYSHFLVHWYLAHSYYKIYDYSKSLKHLNISIKLKSEDTLNLNFLGEILLQKNEYNKAIKSFEKVLKLENNNITALSNLAKIYSELGEFDNSKNYYLKIIKLEPQNIGAHYELMKLDSSYLNENLIKELKNFDLDEKDKLKIVYSNLIYAENENRKKNIENEIKNYIEAKEVFSKSKIIALKQENNYFFNLLPKFIDNFKNCNFTFDGKIKPIFVMGLPRSGTTLVENIICSGLKSIKSAEESGVIGKVFFRNQIIKNYDSNQLITNFNEQQLKVLDDEIKYQYKEIGIDINKSLFTDKSLENFLYIELLSKIFPNAKFVYCKRNRLANFFGILKVFMPNLLWTNSIKGIVEMMNLYENKLIKIIEENKIKIKVVNLEELTANTETVSKNLYQFLGLKWNSNIIDMNQSKKKIIKTLSSHQVRGQIINKDLSYLNKYIPILKKLNIEI